MRPAPSSPGLQRTILRLVQALGPIDRSTLGQKSRSYDPDNWNDIMDDLVQRGLITERSEIRMRKHNKRAIIMYEIGDHGEFPDFSEMTPKQVQKFVLEFSAPAATVS
jgi:hypothetical protein